MLQIDTTQITTFQTCPQKYKYQFIDGIRKIQEDEREIDKKFGSYVHKTLETYYKHKNVDIPAIWKDFVDLPPQYEENHKTRANGVSLTTDYFSHYHRDSDWEVLAVERPLVINLATDIRYLVKVDLVVKTQDNIYAVEHKTTKSLRYGYFTKFSPNMQVSAQTCAVKENFGQCSGVLVNVLESGFRKRAYKGEPAGFYANYQREIVNRTMEQVADFKANAVVWANRIQGHTGAGVWGKCEARCHDFKGCQYKEACLSCNDSQIIEQLYEKCDPYAYLKEE